MQPTIQPLASSYRDPSGFVFEKNGSLYRQVNKVFRHDFDFFISSGCYDHLVKQELLIPHKEVNENFSGGDQWYKTLEPEKLPFISYPYEWSFNMLKEAALLTLLLMKESIRFGLILKDATPTNVQWRNGKMIFIDSLSFEKYDASKPWIAYRQFCETFLSPLLLMYYSKQPVQPLMLGWPEGIPISVTKSLLPWRSRLSFYTFLHIHLHERFSAASKPAKDGKMQFSEKKLNNILSSLQSLTDSLTWKGKQTTWENYYGEARQRSDYLDQKKQILENWITEMPEVKSAIDLGANEGEFAFLLSAKNISTVATDFDHSAINNLYKRIKKENIKNILPLLVDLSQPSPAIGVNNAERSSFISRAKFDLALALALVHHLAIGKNIPFEKIAQLFASITTNLIIEFVPKNDEKIQVMLKQKKDIYTNYTEENFVSSFEKLFSVVKKQAIGNSGRTLYLMKKYE
jgi:hypothetical protein